jgi:nucleotide-binding universal stress UspA family protein
MYHKVLVPLDGSEMSEMVLPHVSSLVKAGEIGEVTFLYVIESIPIKSRLYEEMEAHHETAAKTYLDELTHRLDYGQVKIIGEIMQGDPASAIVDYAKSNNVDLIILATHGRSGVSRWVLGSVADKVMHYSCAPVLMVRVPGCATIPTEAPAPG